MNFKVTDTEFSDLRLAIADIRTKIKEVSEISVVDPLLAQEELESLLSESQSLSEAYGCFRDVNYVENLDFDDIRYKITQKGMLFNFKFKDSEVIFSSDGKHLFAWLPNGEDFFNKELIESNILNYDKKDNLIELILELKRCKMLLCLSDVKKENTRSGLEFIERGYLKNTFDLSYYKIELQGTSSGHVELDIVDEELDFESYSTFDGDDLIKSLKFDIDKYFGTDNEYLLFSDGHDESTTEFFVVVRKNSFGHKYIDTYFYHNAKNLVELVKNIDSDDILSLWKFSVEDGLV